MFFIVFLCGPQSSYSTDGMIPQILQLNFPPKTLSQIDTKINIL